MKKTTLDTNSYIVLSSLGDKSRIYSVWPAFEPYPMIYRFVYGPARKEDCEAWIRDHGHPDLILDMRQISLDVHIEALHSMALQNLRKAAELISAQLGKQSNSDAPADSTHVLPEVQQIVASVNYITKNYEALYENVRLVLRAPIAEKLGRGKWSDTFTETGNDAMVTGGSIVAIGAIGTPGIPDGEAVGSAVFLAGAAMYGIGKVLKATGM